MREIALLVSSGHPSCATSRLISRAPEWVRLVRPWEGLSYGKTREIAC